MSRIIAFLLIFCSYVANAQDHPFNTYDWWNKLIIDSSTTVKVNNVDTSIIVVTSRQFTGDKLRFMSEERGTGNLLYFFCYAHNGQWHLIKTQGLKEAISYTPNTNANWVIYTEGMGKIFTSELDRGMRMNAQYGVNVIMLDYPSITTTKSRIGNYFFAINNARESYADFAPVMNSIKELKLNGHLGTGSLNLFYHSMGNYLIRNIVLKGKLKQLNDSKWVDNLILNSACVPQHGHQKWLHKINFAKDIYINYNPEDRVLIGAKIASKKTQLGNKAKPPVYIKAHYVNFNPIIGIGHSSFLDLYKRKPMSTIAKQYYQQILNGKQVDFNDTSLYQKSNYKNVGYEFFPN